MLLLLAIYAIFDKIFRRLIAAAVTADVITLIRCRLRLFIADGAMLI